MVSFRLTILANECCLCRFEKLSTSAYEHQRVQAKKVKVPLFGSVAWPPSAEDLFGANLTYTFGGFSNRTHYDNDLNDYTFGIWFPVTFPGKKYNIVVGRCCYH